MTNSVNNLRQCEQKQYFVLICFFRKWMFKSINPVTTSVRAGNIIMSVLYMGKLRAQKGFVISQSYAAIPYLNVQITTYKI